MSSSKRAAEDGNSTKATGFTNRLLDCVSQCSASGHVVLHSSASQMVLTTRSHVEALEPDLVPEYVSEVIRSQYFLVSIFSVLVYDTLITLDKEARYFWKIPKRPVDFVYFVNRYVGIVGATAVLYSDSFSVTLPSCNFGIWTYNLAGWVTIISVDYILMIRVLALYSQDKKLALLLKTLLILEAVTKLGLFISIVLLGHIAVGGFADMTFCGVDNIAPWQLGVGEWLIPIAYGMILMILAIYKAAAYWRMSYGFKGFALVKVLIRDQVMYYALVIGCSLFAILEFRLAVSNVFLSDLLSNLGNPSFLCILGSRMLFNMKEVGERGQNEGTSYRSPSSTMSEMEFAEPANPQREGETESGGTGENP